MTTFPSVADLVAYCRTTDTLGGVQLRVPIEPVQEDSEPAPDEPVEDDLEGECATAFLLQEALTALEPQ